MSWDLLNNYCCWYLGSFRDSGRSKHWEPQYLSALRIGAKGSLWQECFAEQVGRKVFGGRGGLVALLATSWCESLLTKRLRAQGS